MLERKNWKQDEPSYARFIVVRFENFLENNSTSIRIRREVKKHRSQAFKNAFKKNTMTPSKKFRFPRPTTWNAKGWKSSRKGSISMEMEKVSDGWALVKINLEQFHGWSRREINANLRSRKRKPDDMEQAILKLESLFHWSSQIVK